MKQINTILFDFDGTICDSLKVGFDIANRLSSKYNFKRVDMNELHLFRNMTSEEVIRSLGISYFKLPFIASNFRKLLNAEIKNLTPFEHIIEEIIFLHEKGYRIGILSSNSKENVQQFLANNNIYNCFSFLQTGTSLFGKAASIRKVLKKQKLEKHEVLLVGDETRDIAAAQNCGIKVMAVTWGFHTREILEKYEPDYLIQHAKELRQIKFQD